MNSPLSDFILHYLSSIGSNTHFLPTLFLTLCRLVPIIHLSPFLGAKNLPVIVKMGMAVGLFPFMFPSIILHSENLTFGNELIALMFKELFVGYIIGMTMSVPFYIMMMSGSVIDHQRGSSSLMLSDPMLQIQDSALGILMMYSLCIIYWAHGIPFKIFEMISESFSILSIDSLLPMSFLSGDWNATQIKFEGLLSKLFTDSMQIAAPALAVLMMADMFLGIANRLAPQVQVSFLGQSLKAFAGILAVTMSWENFIKALFTKGKDLLYELHTLITTFY